ncbi:MAG TPA: site-specific integrase, partial [Chitinophagaceae bacterium]|nr:site-specific integrase [Chitinophagaceae bacterium]
MPLISLQTIQPYIEYLKFEKRYSAHTLTAYKADLYEFTEFVKTQFGETDLASIHHGVVRSWLARLKEQGLAAKSLNRKISTLKSFFKYLIKNGVIDISPMAKVISPRIGKRLPVFVKEEE